MKQSVIFIILSLLLVSCSNEPESKKAKRQFPDPHIKTADIVSMTIIRLDSNEKTSPSPNDTRFVVTNKLHITKFNEIIHESLSTLQSEMYPKCVPWEVAMFDIELKSEELHLGIGLYKNVDDGVLYANIAGPADRFFMISRAKEMLQLLDEVGFSIKDFEISPPRGAEGGSGSEESNP